MGDDWGNQVVVASVQIYKVYMKDPCNQQVYVIVHDKIKEPHFCLEHLKRNMHDGEQKPNEENTDIFVANQRENAGLDKTSEPDLFHKRDGNQKIKKLVDQLRGGILKSYMAKKEIH
ncbi:hypothetical protein D3C78_795200 [compost metagenome]